MALPERSEIVIIGGGVIGCSIAHSLARRGRTGVTIIERRRLTEGSTWHAAGMVGQPRSSASLTRLMRSETASWSRWRANVTLRPGTAGPLYDLKGGRIRC